MHLRCVYSCGICDRYYDNHKDCVMHRKREHPNERIKTLAEIQQEIRSERIKMMLAFNNHKRCIDCEIDFTSFEEITAHFSTIHRLELHVCVQCEKGYTAKAAYARHLGRSHNSPIFNWSIAERRRLMIAVNKKRCIICEKTFANTSDVVQHFWVAHRMKIHFCAECDRGFSNKNSLNDHSCSSKLSKKLMMSAVTKALNNRRCLDCNITFENMTEIRNHFKALHFQVYVCGKCDKTFTNKSSCRMGKHLCSRERDQFQMMREFRQQYCNQCKYSFTNKSDGMRHFLERHQFKIYSCEKCNKALTSPRHHKCKRSLDRESAARETDISNKSSGQEALAVNRNVTKYPCCLCPFEITSYESGLSHYAEVHDIRIFECPAPNCWKLFKRYSKWARHFLKLHDDVVLPEHSEFRTLLDDIVSDPLTYIYSITQSHFFCSFPFQMQQTYNKSVADDLMSSRENTFWTSARE